MSRSRDPRWLPLAEQVYGLCLWLYPPEVRRVHGEQMRQAFRDRCRETVDGSLSAWRLFALELFPDMLTSAARSNADTGFGRHERRNLIGLVFLSVLSIALLTQPRWSGTLLDGFKSVQVHWLMLREARESKRQETVILSLASALDERHQPQAQALSAYLHRSLYRRETLYAYFATPGTDDDGPMQVRYPHHGDAATHRAASLLATAPDLYTLSLAVQSCVIESGCNRDLALRRLLARDPDNAFGWMLEFKRAASLDQRPRMKAALEGIGRSSYFENHQGSIHRELFAAAQAFAPGDAALLADVSRQAHHGMYMDTDDYQHDARSWCSLRREPTPSPRTSWIEATPDGRAACLHLASLLARSPDLVNSFWGWLQLGRAGAAPEAAINTNWRQVTWLRELDFDFGVVRDPNGRAWREWDDAAWREWAASWATGDGQIPALQRWLVAAGKPEHAPGDFQPPRI